MSKKELLGLEVAEIIKNRHASVVRTMSIKPRLAIVCANDDPVTAVYLRIKQAYARDIGVDVEVVTTDLKSIIQDINALNSRADIHGIIVQLPLPDPTLTDEALATVDPVKDIDGLGPNSSYDPATPTAILWLLAAYNIDLRDKRVLVVGQGRVVGAPLTKMLQNSGVDVVIADETTQNLAELCQEAKIIVSAAGVPGLIKESAVPLDAILVDAGTSTDNGEVVGDVASDVRERQDVTITPKKGGVGPLTVAALFENLLFAARSAGL